MSHSRRTFRPPAEIFYETPTFHFTSGTSRISGYGVGVTLRVGVYGFWVVALTISNLAALGQNLTCALIVNSENFTSQKWFVAVVTVL